MRNNFIQKKPSQNCKLLTLLTNRQRAKSVPNLRNDWPGKINPNFTLTLKADQNNQINDINYHKMPPKRFNSKLISQIPSIKVPESGQLCLQPCKTSRKNFRGQTSQSLRIIQSRYSNRKETVIRIQQNEDAPSMSRIFKNSKINTQVNKAIDKELHLTERKNQKQKIRTMVNNRTFTNLNYGSHSKQKVSLRQSPLKNHLSNKFKIDFMAFGYIEKVIDNPQLWQKYVHKMQTNQYSQQPQTSFLTRKD